jgi:hypothetical protein
MPTPSNSADQGYRGRLADIHQGIRNRWFNYHNVEDFWLATGETSGWLLGMDVHWIKNQREYKPSDVLGSTAYRYHPDDPPGQRCLLEILGHDNDRPVDNDDEAAAFIARSRTSAVGAEAADGNPRPPEATGTVDLNDVYQFGGPRYDHSGQFQRDVQLMYSRRNGELHGTALYRRLMSDLGVLPQ